MNKRLLPLLVVPVLASFPAFADPSTAEVTRTVNYMIGVQEIRDVRVTNEKPLSYRGYPATAVGYADIEFDLMVLPNGCNTSYYDGEILAHTEAQTPWYSTDPSVKVELGTLDPIGVGWTCVGKPPRAAHLKLMLVNGIGADFDKDRVFTYEFVGPMNYITDRPGRWLVRVAVNQAAGTFKVVDSTLDKGDPVIAKAYTETLDCDLSGRFHKDGKIPDEDHLVVVLTKVAGDPVDSKNYAVRVSGASKSLTGDSNAFAERALKPDVPPQWGLPTDIAFIDAAFPGGVLKMNTDSRFLGWTPNRELNVNWAFGPKRQLFSTCKVKSLEVQQ